MGRHKKALAKLARIEGDREKEKLDTMDYRQRAAYYQQKEKAAIIDPRDVADIVIDGFTFKHSEMLDAHIMKPLGQRGVYPPANVIPPAFFDGAHPGNKVAHKLFFNGGKIEDYGYKRDWNIARMTFYVNLYYLLTDFSPSAGHKMAAVARFLERCCTEWPYTVPREPVTYEQVKERLQRGLAEMFPVNA